MYVLLFVVDESSVRAADELYIPADALIDIRSSSEFNIWARKNCSVEYTVSNRMPFCVISTLVKNQKAGTALHVKDVPEMLLVINCSEKLFIITFFSLKLKI